MKDRLPYPESVAERQALAERFARLAEDARWSAAERAEFLRTAQRWARTLPEGPAKERILSLDGR